MSGKKAVVFTATGDQGSSVALSLVKAGYKVTGLTRNPESESAQKLKAQGVETVKADQNDPSSYKAALQGVDAAFVNADFWTIYMSNGYNGPEAAKVEIKQSKDAIQACADAGVGHIVYSTLDKDSGAEHWESKAEVAAWARSAKIPITGLYTNFYMSNIVKFNLVAKQDDGSFLLNMPAPDETKVPSYPVEQTGLWVAAALANPQKWKGKDMHCCTDIVSVADEAKILSTLSGKTVNTLHVTKEAFHSKDLKSQIGQEMWDNWNIFYLDKAPRDVSEGKASVQGAWSFEEWAKQDPSLKKILGY